MDHLDGTFHELKLTSEQEGRVLLLELNHGKANEMGSAQLAEFEKLTELLERDSGVMGLITFSRRKSSRGTPIFIAGANVSERAGWAPERVPGGPVPGPPRVPRGLT